MQNTIVVLIVIILIIIAGFLGFVFFARNQQTSTTNIIQEQISTSTDDNLSTTSRATSTSEVYIAIKNSSFNPQRITVPEGTMVTWNNQDSIVHSVNFTDGPGSGDISRGESFSVIFSESGTFDYSCSNHPTMKGTVTVTK